MYRSIGSIDKNGLSKTDRDAVANTIRHLRKHLEQIPVIRIEAIRGVGYQMIILFPHLTRNRIKIQYPPITMLKTVYIYLSNNCQIACFLKNITPASNLKYMG